MGPGAGENGGRVTFAGTYGQLLAPPAAKDREHGVSLTGRYLRGEVECGAAPRTEESE